MKTQGLFIRHGKPCRLGLFNEANDTWLLKDKFFNHMGVKLKSGTRQTFDTWEAAMEATNPYRGFDSMVRPKFFFVRPKPKKSFKKGDKVQVLLEVEVLDSCNNAVFVEAYNGQRFWLDEGRIRESP